MKKIVLLTAALVVFSLFAFAASPVVGSWDCIVFADMDYSFVLKLVEKDGNLLGTADAPEGFDVGPVTDVNLEDGVLVFTIDNPMAGMVDFEAKLEGDTLKGTFDTYDFSGEFTGDRQK